MAKKIDIASLDSIAENLETEQEWQSEVNFREVVRRLFFSIDAAVQRKASWEQIAQHIEAALKSEESINPNTLRQYYFYFKKNKRELPKKARKASLHKNKQNSSPSQNSPTRMNSGTPASAARSESLPTQNSIDPVAPEIAGLTESTVETESLNGQLLPEPKQASRSKFAY